MAAQQPARTSPELRARLHSARANVGITPRPGALPLDNERDARQSKKHRLPRDPSREMFAIDTGNPDLPTYPIDDFDDFQRKN